jgi:hypothetical protein
VRLSKSGIIWSIAALMPPGAISVISAARTLAQPSMAVVATAASSRCFIAFLALRPTDFSEKTTMSISERAL